MKSLPCLDGGRGYKGLRPAILLFLSPPPLPAFNNRSLRGMGSLNTGDVDSVGAAVCELVEGVLLMGCSLLYI